MTYDSATSLFNELCIGLSIPCALQFLPPDYKVLVETTWPLDPSLEARAKVALEIANRRGHKTHMNILGVMEIS